MKVETLVIEKKRYAVIPEKEYLEMKEDIADLKLVFKRRNEKGMEAKLFFEKFKNSKK